MVGASYNNELYITVYDKNDHTSRNFVASRDSRYFGLVPEKFIVGTTEILWKTKDRERSLRTIKW